MTVGYFPNYAVASITGQNVSGNVAYTLDSKGRPYSATADSGAINLVNSTAYNFADQALTVNIGLGDSDVFGYDPFSRPGNFTYTVGSGGTSVSGTIGYNSGSGTLASLQIVDGFNSAATQTCSFGYDCKMSPAQQRRLRFRVVANVCVRPLRQHHKVGKHLIHAGILCQYKSVYGFVECHL